MQDKDIQDKVIFTFFYGIPQLLAPTRRTQPEVHLH